MVTINIGRKEMVFFSVIILVFAVVGFGVAINSGNYQTMGHSMNEIEKCADGEFLVMSGGSWTCGVAAGGTNTVTLGSFGVLNDMSSLASGAVQGPAVTDGLVSAYSNGGDPQVEGFTDSTSSPTTKMASNSFSGDTLASITFPVKKGDYWKVEYAGSTNAIYWMPIASGGDTGVVVGEYTGNGAPSQSINLGFNPSLILLSRQDTSQGHCSGMCIKSPLMSQTKAAADGASWNDITITATGFSVDLDLNNNGGLFHYSVWR